MGVSMTTVMMEGVHRKIQCDRGQVQSTGEHLLIVEPDPSMAAQLSRWLEELGMTATMVPTGEEGMKVLRKAQIDAILLALDAPGMNGLVMLTQLRQRYADLPVLVMVGAEQTESLLEALESGACDYLTKPVRHHLLIQKLARLFRE
ncbi:MAG: response regulator [Nitrospirae bacterium]|nr:MAG: response regulator [Nitrospirota bacterium]